MLIHTRNFRIALRQTFALCCKCYILFWKSWFWTLIRALILPIAYTVFLGYAQDFFYPASTYGVGNILPALSLKDAVQDSLIAFYSNSGPNLTDLEQQILNNAFSDIPNSQLIKLTNASEIDTVCGQSLRGISKCYAAIAWNGIDLTTNTYNYTLRPNSGLYRINVFNHKSYVERYILPIQMAVDDAIRNQSTVPQVMAYTSYNDWRNKQIVRDNYLKNTIKIIAPAFILIMIGVVYHLAGTMAVEREIGMAKLLEGMGVYQISRLLAIFTSFSSIYLPSWIASGAILWKLLLPSSPATVPIIFHILFGFALVSYSMFMASFFNRSQLAGVLTSGFCVFTAIMVIVQTSQTGATDITTIYVLSFLFPGMNYTYFIQNLARWEYSHQPVNLIKNSPDGSVANGMFWIAAVVQIFGFFIGTYIVERVQYGTHVHHKIDPRCPYGVQIKGLTKIYRPSILHIPLPKWFVKCFMKDTDPEVFAVDDLNLSILEGQIYCLLGSNGSGKTTTLDIISGIQSATSGCITMNDESSIGICPQHNVLWNDLTVYEHVKIWSLLKGTLRSEIDSDCEIIINKCDLLKKKNARAATLSGGQQRKLQLAVMLCGGSKICCVDEVSSGMDPISRHKIWNILRAIRGEATIIMTTHFLDEADLLSDHIAIMSLGHLRVEGLSIDLKEKYGRGYIVEYKDPTSSNKHRVELATGAETGEFIKYLEDNKIKYKIEGPSLEEVFMRIASPDLQSNSKSSVRDSAHLDLSHLKVEKKVKKGNDNKKKGTNNLSIDETKDSNNLTITKTSSAATPTANNTSLIASDSSRTFTSTYGNLKDNEISEKDSNILPNSNNIIPNDILNNGQDNNNSPNDSASLDAESELEQATMTSFWDQIGAILYKRLIILKRGWIIPLIMLFLPAIVGGVTQTYLKSYTIPTCTFQEYKSDSYGSSIGALFGANFIGGSQEQYYSSLPGVANFLYAVGSFSGYTRAQTQFFLPAFTQRIAFVDTIDNMFTAVDNNYGTVTPGGFHINPPGIAFQVNGFYANSAGFSLQNMLTNILANGTATVAANIEPMAGVWVSSFGDVLQFIIYFSLALSVYPAFASLYPTLERVRKVRALQYSNGLRVMPLWLAHFFFDAVIVSVTSAVSIIILYKCSPWAFYDFGYIFLIFILYGFASILLSYIISLFVKSQLSAFAIVAAFQVLYMLGYFVAYMVTVTYAPALGIDSNLVAINFTLSLVAPVASLMRSLFVAMNVFGVRCNGSAFREYPGELLVFGGPILYLCCQIIIYYLFLIAWDSGQISVVFEKLKNLDFLRGNKSFESDVEITEAYSKDVRKETERVDSEVKTLLDIKENNSERRHSISDQDKSLMGLKVVHLKKVFGRGSNRFFAVNDATFGIHPDECFALLGPNGAGKTTTINIIRGELSPSDGTVYVDGWNAIGFERSKAHEHLGVCPQFDAMDWMTVHETLNFYSRLKGIPKSSILKNVDAVIRAVGLDKFRRRQAYALSGGNRRKLSLAVALLGNPGVLLLDEPSSGMDAVAKRRMWRTLSSISHNRAILLTTHSMEEADALASRVGIIAGKMLAAGSSEELRKSQGSFYLVHIVLNSAPDSTNKELKSIKRWIFDRFGYVDCEDLFMLENTITTTTTHRASMALDGAPRVSFSENAVGDMIGWTGQMKFAVPLHNRKLSEYFQILESAKIKLNIRSYSISPTTLEQVFLAIVGKEEKYN